MTLLFQFGSWGAVMIFGMWLLSLLGMLIRFR